MGHGLNLEMGEVGWRETYAQRAEAAAILMHGNQTIDILIRLRWPCLARGAGLYGTGGGIHTAALSNYRRTT